MAKTTFGPGVIVTSKFLNGAQQIYFDGADLDWHYPPINSSDIQRGGALGLDTLYVTTTSDQIVGGVPIAGAKDFLGLVQFGTIQASNGAAAPLSWNTNAKFNGADATAAYGAKYANLSDQDVVTKLVLSQSIANFPVIDQGTF